MGIGAARAKLLLLGEHAAVYGHPALGLSLPWPLTARWEAGPRWAFPGLGPHEEAVAGLVVRLADLGADRGLARPAPGTLTLETSIPLGSGFGSSGALCAALVNLFWPALPLAERDLLAWQAEGLFHGTPSGIDTALALREGWWALDPSVRPAGARPLPDPGLALVTGSLVRRADTKALVGALARRRSEGDRGVVEALDRLGHRAAAAIADLEAGPAPGSLVDRLAAHLTAARDDLRRLDLETEALTRVLDGGLTLPGARAGKLSGAGGGGAFLVLFASADEARAALAPLATTVDAGEWTCLPRLVGSLASPRNPA